MFVRSHVSIMLDREFVIKVGFSGRRGEGQGLSK